MATPFDLPNLDSEQDRVRALGVKNSGVKEFSFDRVFPVNRLNSQDGSLVNTDISADSKVELGVHMCTGIEHPDLY